MNAAALFVQPKNMAENRVYGNPELLEIMSQLQAEFTPYKYTVYRCAGKIIKLQKYLYTNQISYKLVETVVQQHGMSGVNACSFMIPPFQLTSLIRDIYKVAEKLGNFKSITNFELEKAAIILSNFFWNIFDPKRRHSISLLEVKAVLVILCRTSSNCQDIIEEFYKLIHDHKSKNILRIQFENLLNIFAKMLSYVGECKAYGPQNVSEIVEQCFLRCQSPMGLTAQQFENLWFSSKTKFHIYANLIVTIKRMESTEKIVHMNPCASCGLHQIIGIRFKCQKCKNISLCMRCFTSGYTTNKHRPGHPVIEMFNEDQPQKNMTHYLAKLCNFFTTTQTNSDAEEIKRFCNTNEANIPNETELVTCKLENDGKSIKKETIDKPVCNNAITTTDPSLAGLSTAASNASEVSARLQSIIDRILIQNFKIEQYLKFVPSATPEQISEFLRSHQQFLTDIITEMRNFKCRTNTTLNSYPTSSTPNHSGSLNKAILLDSSSISGNNLTHSINGADVNRTYLEANKSDYSLSDISVWFNQRRPMPQVMKRPNLDVVAENLNDNTSIIDDVMENDMRETEMTNFRILLHKVKEIVDDSYSDNVELAAATQNLENVLDCIIKGEESQRYGLK